VPDITETNIGEWQAIVLKIASSIEIVKNTIELVFLCVDAPGGLY